MKTSVYPILFLAIVVGFSSCTVRKQGAASAHYKTRPYGKYYVHRAGYAYVHPRPPID
jgi:hypothetical protein